MSSGAAKRHKSGAVKLALLIRYKWHQTLTQTLNENGITKIVERASERWRALKETKNRKLYAMNVF